MTTVVKTGRGGARPGAGRKKGSGDGLTSKLQVCVTPQQEKTFIEAGGAKWMRQMLDLERRITVVPDKTARFVCPPMALFPALNLPRRAMSLESLSDFSRRSCGGRDVDFNEVLVPSARSSIIIQIDDETMLDAGLQLGDFVVVDRLENASSGSIVLVRLGGDFVIRRIEFKGRYPELHACNEKRKFPVIFPARDDDWQVIGVVTGVARRLV